MRILFMGTPDFAVKPLQALAAAYHVVAVVTQPDKPRGRHGTPTPSPVKAAAGALSIPVYQPQRLKDNAFLEDLTSIDPEMIVVAAYGKILPAYVLQYPKFGCINLHGSLLPKYRGAAPIQRAIMNGESLTGVTTMQMAEGLDTGDMLEKAETVIAEDDNFETVHDRLSEMGASLLVSTIHKLVEGTLVPQKQDDAEATYAAKIEDADCALDFQKSAQELFHTIRGLSPFPLSYCTHKNKRLKILDARAICEEALTETQRTAPVGTVLDCSHGAVLVRCGRGALSVLKVLPEGKGRMSAADFINGRQITPGDRLLPG